MLVKRERSVVSYELDWLQTRAQLHPDKQAIADSAPGQAGLIKR